MAVTSIAPQHRGRGGGKEKDNRGFYTLAYVVRTDNAYDEAGVVLAASPSRIGDSYNNGIGFVDTKSYCVRLRPEQDSEDRHTWRLYADFEPQDRIRTRIKVTFEKKKKAVVGVRKREEYPQQPSQNGDTGVNKSYLYSSLVANSYGDPFDPAPEYEVSYPVVVYKRREPMANFTLWNHFKDAVNIGTWSGAMPRCAKVMSIEADDEYIYEGGVEKKIWHVTYKIGYDEDTWDIQKLDAGYHFKYETGNAEGETAGTTGTFYDTDGTTPRIGLLSNEVGVGSIKGIRLTDLTVPEFKTFEVFPLRNFTLLNLPEDINIFEPA